MERERFEAWITGPPYERDTSRHPEQAAWPGQYVDLAVQLAWEAWQEAHGDGAAPRWTAVAAEGLPAEGAPVLVLTPLGQQVARYRSEASTGRPGGLWWSGDQGGNCWNPRGVSAWRPLPPGPPEEGEPDDN